MTTVIVEELKRRATDRANMLKVKIEALEAMETVTKVLEDRKMELEIEYQNAVDEIVDFEERKHRSEIALENGLITFEEAQHVMEHDAVDTFFK